MDAPRTKSASRRNAAGGRTRSSNPKPLSTGCATPSMPRAARARSAGQRFRRGRELRTASPSGRAGPRRRRAQTRCAPNRQPEWPPAAARQMFDDRQARFGPHAHARRVQQAGSDNCAISLRTQGAEAKPGQVGQCAHEMRMAQNPRSVSCNAACRDAQPRCLQPQQLPAPAACSAAPPQSRPTRTRIRDRPNRRRSRRSVPRDRQPDPVPRRRAAGRSLLRVRLMLPLRAGGIGDPDQPAGIEDVGCKAAAQRDEIERVASTPLGERGSKPAPSHSSFKNP